MQLGAYKPGGFRLEAGPTTKMLHELCDGWLGPFGARSNSVSQGNEELSVADRDREQMGSPYVGNNNYNPLHNTTDLERLWSIRSSTVGEVIVDAIMRATSADEEHHCAISLTRRANDELVLHDNRFQNETLGGCRGFPVRLHLATIIALVSHILMYREGYLLCSRFDSYLGRCCRGGARIPISS